MGILLKVTSRELWNQKSNLSIAGRAALLSELQPKLARKMLRKNMRNIRIRD